MTAEGLRTLVKEKLGFTVIRKYFFPLLSEWEIEVAPSPVLNGTRKVPATQIRKLEKKERALRRKLETSIKKENRAEWQILGLPRGNRRDGPGPQWRKREYDQEKRNYFYLELWTEGSGSLLTPESRQLLRKKIYAYSRHLGVDVLSYVIMDSHCFLLVTLPPRGKWLQKIADPDRLLERARELYQPAQYQHMVRQFSETKDPEKLLKFHQREFCDLSIFVKMVKESLSRAQNRQQNTTGSLWMPRFRSLQLTEPEKTIGCHLRINRWPVTRGLVPPGELATYPWSSYGELMGSSKRAIKGTCRVLGIPVAEWKKPYPGDSKKGRKRTARNWFMAQMTEDS